MGDARPDIFTAAAALAGTRFRLHGRDPENGLDCIGLVLAAHAAVGIGLTAPDDYSLRGWPLDKVLGWLRRTGLVPTAGPPLPGDIALIDAGFGQWHFGIVGHGDLAHADARLRRVVVSPWHGENLLGCWRARRGSVTWQR